MPEMPIVDIDEHLLCLKQVAVHNVTQPNIPLPKTGFCRTFESIQIETGTRIQAQQLLTYM